MGQISGLDGLTEMKCFFLMDPKRRSWAMLIPTVTSIHDERVYLALGAKQPPGGLLLSSTQISSLRGP